MDKEHFKAAAMASLQPFQEQIGAQRIALDLYEHYGLRGKTETYERRIRSCFDITRPEFFLFSDVVNMMLLYGIHDPLHFQCDLLGFQRPPEAQQEEKIQLLRRRMQERQRAQEADEQQLRALESACQPRHFEGARFSRGTP